jgi:hypothetical protein
VNNENRVTVMRWYNEGAVGKRMRAVWNGGCMGTRERGNDGARVQGYEGTRVRECESARMVNIPGSIRGFTAFEKH